MAERKTRGRQRIPIKLIQSKDDLLVSFSKRRNGLYKKASEISTLCDVDVGAVLFSPSDIPYSFFSPDFDAVVLGGGGSAHHLDGARARIRELNRRVDEVVEQQGSEEKREKLLDAAVGAAAMGWWEVPVENLDAEQVKEQIEWFRTLKAQVKTRAQELRNGGAMLLPPPPQDGGGLLGGECFFAPLPLCDVGGGNDYSAAGQYSFAPAVVDPNVGGGSGFITGRNYFAPPSLDLFGGIGIGQVPDHYFYAPPLLGGGNNHIFCDGDAEAGPSHRNEN